MKSYEAEKTEDLTNVIFLDIETWAGDKPPIELFEPKANLVDPLKILKDVEEKQDKAWRAQSLNPLVGEVFCVGLAVDEGEPFVIVGTDEQETLEMLDIELHNYSWPKVVAHNGFDFDFLFLFYRGLKYRMKRVVDLFSQKGPHLIDTMKILDGTSWKTMTSQNNMSKLLLGRSGKGGITGKDVHDLILKGEGDRVLNYCKEDVRVLRDCYRVLESLGLHR